MQALDCGGLDNRIDEYAAVDETVADQSECGVQQHLVS